MTVERWVFSLLSFLFWSNTIRWEDLALIVHTSIQTVDPISTDMISFMNISVIIAGAYITYLFFTQWSRQARAARANHQYGCKHLFTITYSWDPLFGLDLFIKIRLADFAGRRSEAYRLLHQNYGPTFLMKALGTELQTSEQENIQAICTSRFNDFGVGPMRGDIGVPFLDRGIFTEDGEFWKHSRALIRPVFSKAEVSDLPNFEWHVASFCLWFQVMEVRLTYFRWRRDLWVNAGCCSIVSMLISNVVLGYVNRIPLWSINRMFVFPDTIWDPRIHASIRSLPPRPRITSHFRTSPMATLSRSLLGKSLSLSPCFRGQTCRKRPIQTKFYSSREKE